MADPLLGPDSTVPALVGIKIFFVGILVMVFFFVEYLEIINPLLCI